MNTNALVVEIRPKKKKIQARTGFNPWPLRYRYSALVITLDPNKSFKW